MNGARLAAFHTSDSLRGLQALMHARGSVTSQCALLFIAKPSQDNIKKLLRGHFILASSMKAFDSPHGSRTQDVSCIMSSISQPLYLNSQ